MPRCVLSSCSIERERATQATRMRQLSLICNSLTCSPILLPRVRTAHGRVGFSLPAQWTEGRRLSLCLWPSRRWSRGELRFLLLFLNPVHHDFLDERNRQGFIQREFY